MSHNSELEIQIFLRNDGTLSDLEQRYGIKSKRHTKYQNLILLKYDQINSPMAEMIVRECRGIILDESQNWNVVSRSLNKFFNYGEGHAASIDWATAVVQEKLDGSLCTLYWYNGWNVATTGTPDASGNVNGLGMTFADLFWNIWKEMKLELPTDHRCYMFELTSPYNRVVIRHMESKLTLLGIRNPETGEEFVPTGYPSVQAHSLSTLGSVISTFDKMNPLEHEGYVIVDQNFNRIKVKHPGYVAIHHLKDGFGPKRILEIIRSGESSELLTHFPEWELEFKEVEIRYSALVNEITKDFERIKDIQVQKDFALEAVKTRCSGALFALRNNKVASIREFLANIQINNLMEILGMKNEVA